MTDHKELTYEDDGTQGTKKGIKRKEKTVKATEKDTKRGRPAKKKIEIGTEEWRKLDPKRPGKPRKPEDYVSDPDIWEALYEAVLNRFWDDASNLVFSQWRSIARSRDGHFPVNTQRKRELEGLRAYLKTADATTFFNLAENSEKDLAAIVYEQFFDILANRLVNQLRAAKEKYETKGAKTQVYNWACLYEQKVKPVEEITAEDIRAWFEIES